MTGDVDVEWYSGSFAIMIKVCCQQEETLTERIKYNIHMQQDSCTTYNMQYNMRYDTRYTTDNTTHKPEHITWNKTDNIQ